MHMPEYWEEVEQGRIRNKFFEFFVERDIDFAPYEKKVDEAIEQIAKNKRSFASVANEILVDWYHENNRGTRIGKNLGIL